MTLRVWRTGLLIRQGRMPAAEIALDSVSVEKAGTTVQRFRELEIELQQDDEDTLRTLEHRMRKAGASDHDGRPKFFRALSLPAPTPPPLPDSQAPVVDHLKWAFARHVGWLIAHDPGTRLGTESESLHQMRVAVRHVRAVLGTARPILLPAWVASLDQELDWLGELLGTARDLDVQIAYFVKESSEFHARDRTLLADLISHLRSERHAAQQVILVELAGARYFELIRRFHQAAQDPTVIESPFTLHKLGRRAFKKVREAIRILKASPSNRVLHEILIKAKRARYAAEFARLAVGKSADRFIKSARAVQDLLGVHQDAVQTEHHVREFLKYSTSTRAGFVAGRMVERQHQRRQNVRQNLKPLFKTLLKQGRKAWRLNSGVNRRRWPIMHLLRT